MVLIGADESDDSGASRTTLEPCYISRLPVELLSKVFVNLSAIWPTEYTANYTVEPHWARVMLVCRRWKNVALNDPQLWTDIDFTVPNYAIKLLERSRQLPIFVTVPPNIQDEARDALFDLLLEVPRFQALNVSLDNVPETRNPIIGALINIPAPRLASLYLEGSPLSIPGMISIGALLKQGAPRLRDFQLGTWYLPWTSSILTGLSTLKLTNWECRAGPGTWSNFFDALERMPCLEELILHTRLPDSFGRNFQQDRKVILRHLHTLDMKGASGDCETVLNHLHLCASASRRLEWLHTGVRVDAVADFLTVLNFAWIPDTLQMEPHHVSISRLPYLCSFDISAHKDDEYIHPPTKITARWENYGTLGESSITLLSIGEPHCADRILALFSLKKLHSAKLAVPLSRISNQPTLLAILGNLPALASITLTQDSVIDFFSYIYRDGSLRVNNPAVCDPSSSADVITASDLRSFAHFSSFTHLTLEGVYFSFDREEHHPRYTDCQKRGIYDTKLRNYFKYRSKYTQPVQKVTIVECQNFDSGSVSILKEGVADVVWDNHVEVVQPPDNRPSPRYTLRWLTHS